MSRHPLNRWLPAMAAACCTAAAFAAVARPMPAPPASRTSAEPHRADPADARSAVPPLVYRSAFSGYRRDAQAPLASWRDVNDTVNRIGGWRAYAREAAAAAQPAAASDTQAAPAAPPAAPREAPRDGR